jgi:V/A-type H+-transporting ATPase subunit K
METLPLTFAFIGIGILVSLSGCGSVIGTATGAQATVGALKKRPEAFGSFIILSALPGTQGLYGFAGFFILQDLISIDMTLLQGAGILGGGLALGIAGLLSGVYQGKVCASSIDSIGSGNDVFGRAMILAVFPELYAIIAFASLFLIGGIL